MKQIDQKVGYIRHLYQIRETDNLVNRMDMAQFTECFFSDAITNRLGTTRDPKVKLEARRIILLG